MAHSMTPDDLPFRVRTGDDVLLLASAWLAVALRICESSGEVVRFEIVDDFGGQPSKHIEPGDTIDVVERRLEAELTVWRRA